MPQNTTNSNVGVELGYQNPSTVNAALDSEVVGPDPVTGVQLTREFVVPVESISAQTPESLLLDTMIQVLQELKAIRVLLEADQPAETIEAAEQAAAAAGAEDSVAEGIEEN
jgi:hypothetical protein